MSLLSGTKTLQGEDVFGLAENDESMKGSKDEDLGMLKGQPPVDTDGIRITAGPVFSMEHQSHWPAK